MDNIGWIKLYRKSFDNFLYNENRPLTKREAWEDILLRVNFIKGESLIGNEKITCDIGQSTMSLDSWGKIFNWDKSKVRRFFNLLSKNSMIEIENLKKTTRITVCNYDTYQSERNTSETQVKRKRNASETQTTPIEEGKEEEELKNDNNKVVFNFKNELLNLGIEKQIVDDWLQVRKTKKATNTQTALNLIKSQIELSNISANECIKIAVGKSWSGFKAEWIENTKPTNGTKIQLSNDAMVHLPKKVQEQIKSGILTEQQAFKTFFNEI